MKHTQPLTQNRDFLRLYHRGKSQVHPLLVTYAMPNRQQINRVGITASKKIGNAVLRNRARRIIREAYRQLEPGLPLGWDIVFVARGRTPHTGMWEIHSVMDKQLRQLQNIPKGR